jgi:hypothetical protein
MIPTDLLPLTASHTRRIDLIQASTSLPFSSGTISLIYGEKIKVLITAASLGQTTVIDIGGELNGTPDTEAITILSTGSQIARSKKEWTKITSISSVTTGTGTIKASGILPNGQPAFTTSVLAAALPGRLRTKSTPAIVETGRPGVIVAERLVWYTNALDLEPGDRLQISGVDYQIDDSDIVYGARDPHHTEAVIRRL